MSEQSRAEWGKFFRENFDKLLLTALWVASMVFVLHMLHDAADKDSVAWGREAAGTILGALLGLVTGVRIGMAMAKGNGAIEPPAAPVQLGAQNPPDHP